MKAMITVRCRMNAHICAINALTSLNEFTTFSNSLLAGGSDHILYSSILVGSTTEFDKFVERLYDII